MNESKAHASMEKGSYFERPGCGRQALAVAASVRTWQSPTGHGSRVRDFRGSIKPRAEVRLWQIVARSKTVVGAMTIKHISPHATSWLVMILQLSC